MTQMTVYFQGGNGSKNVALALEDYLKDRSVRGRKVLLKPNMVDHRFVDACSDKHQIARIAEILVNHGVDEILLGDEPADYVFRRENTTNANEGLPPFTTEQAYEALGYNTLNSPKVKAITFDNVLRNIVFFRLLAERQGAEVPVRDTSDFLLVNVTLPKHHGDFNYSGACKNLMGLVPVGVEQHGVYNRVKYFHHEANVTLSDEPADEDKSAEARAFWEYYKTPWNAERATHRLHPQFSTDEQISKQCYADHLLNACAITGLTDHIRKSNNDAIHIMDGTCLLAEQEHAGRKIPTDFAAVGADPRAVDLLTIQLIGVNINEVPYLQRMQVPYTVKGTLLPTQPLVPMRSLHDKKLADDGTGLCFRRMW